MRNEFIQTSKGKAADFARFMLYVKINPTEGKCWEWVGAKNAQGYGHFAVKNQSIRAHRWIYMALLGNLEKCEVVCHKCDNPSCVNPIHLIAGTPSDNMKDMVTKGRNPNRKGTRHPMATLTEDQVVELRKRSDLGEKQCDLARSFGVSAGLVGKVVRRERWRHI